MSRVHLFAEMLPYKREIMTKNDLITKHYSTYRRFKTKEELNEYINDNPLKVNEGYYILENKIVKGRQGYASVFDYNKHELEEHLKKNNGSISGFTGDCYSDWLYFDLEHSEGPKVLREKLEPFFKHLKELEINFIFFFSGSQGIHLYIPMEYLQVPDEYKRQANIVCKVFSKMIAKQFPEMTDCIDPQVYGINTVLRMPFTINPKTGLLKMVMEYNADDNTYKRLDESEDFFSLVSNAIWNKSQAEVEPKWVLDESFLDTSEPHEVKFDTYFPAPYGEKVCVYNLLNAHLKKGEHRHDAALRLMGWYHKDKEFPVQFVWSFLQDWNNTLDDPMDIKELKSIFKSVDTINYHLCKDQYMEKYCPKTNVCPFWQEKLNGIKGVSVIGAMKQLEEDEKTKGAKLDFGSIFPGMILEAYPNRGQILSIIAGSKVGKTLISLNIALRAKRPTVIFSYEISKLGILQTFAKMLNLDMNNDLDKKELTEKLKHIFIIDEGRVALQQMPIEVAAIERTFKVKIEIVVADYMQLIPVYDINRAGRFITNQMESLSVMAGLLPEMAKKHKWLMIIPVQPTKGVEGGGRTILLPSSGRGGQAILALSDFVMTAWRPFKNNDPTSNNDDDIVMSLWVGANRWDKEDKIRNYNYKGNRRLIEGVYENHINQLAPIDDIK